MNKERESLNKVVMLGTKEYIHDLTALTYKNLDRSGKKKYRIRLKSKIESILKHGIDEAVLRYLSIADLQVVEKTIFTNLVEETKWLYIGGHYYSAVALCGVLGEIISRMILEKAEIVINKRKLSAKKQFTRLEFANVNRILVATNLINQESYKYMEYIRKLRNDYVHGKGLSKMDKCRGDAKKVLNYIILILNKEFKPGV